MSEVGSYARGIEDAMFGVAADLRHLDAVSRAALNACLPEDVAWWARHQARRELCQELLQKWGLDGG